MIKPTDEVKEYNGIVHAAEEGKKNIVSVSPLFNQLLKNTEWNTQVLAKQRRHADVVKKFATSLLIYCGHLAYNFLYQNIPEGLPSIRTVQNILYNQYHSIHVGKFRLILMSF